MAKERKQIGRIRYVENWHDEGEHFVFEWKWDNEPETEWSLESAFPLVDVRDGEYVYGEGDLIHYTALTKIRDWKKQGIEITFGK